MKYAKHENSKKRHLLQVRMSFLDLQQLDCICEYTGKSRAYIVRRAIRFFYSRYDWKYLKNITDETLEW